jgi:hypothetical protein
MAQRTDSLHVVVMFGRVAEEVIVFVAALTLRPDVSTVGARKRVGVSEPLGANEYVDPLASLLLIAVP